MAVIHGHEVTHTGKEQSCRNENLRVISLIYFHKRRTKMSKESQKRTANSSLRNYCIHGNLEKPRSLQGKKQLSNEIPKHTKLKRKHKGKLIIKRYKGEI